MGIGEAPELVRVGVGGGRLKLFIFALSFFNFVTLLLANDGFCGSCIMFKVQDVYLVLTSLQSNF